MEIDMKKSLVLLASFILLSTVMAQTTGCNNGSENNNNKLFGLLLLSGSFCTPVLRGGTFQGCPLNLSAIVSTIAGPAQGATTLGDTDGTGNAARFYFPCGITTDGTSLYVSDSNNNKFRKIR